MFASGFDPGCIHAVELINNFAKKFLSKISLLYVNTPGSAQYSVSHKKFMGEIRKEYDSSISSMHIENSVNEHDGF